jgi:hypothetical protein
MNSQRSHRIISSILLIVLLAACAKSPTSAPSGSSGAVAENTAAPVAAAPTQTVAAPSSGGCTNAYYPVVSGMSKTYSSTGGALGDYTYSTKIVAVSDTGFSTSYLFSTGVNSLIKWNCQDGNLAALDDGSASLSMTTSKIKMVSSSVTADGYLIPAAFDNGKTWSEKVTVTGTVQTSAGKTVDGQIYNQFDCSAGGADTVTVPAGKFDTVKAVCNKTVVVSAIVKGNMAQLGKNQENITYWYSKDVGFVKSVATGGSNNETVVLIQYKK